MYLIEEVASSSFKKRGQDLMIDGFKRLSYYIKKLDSLQNMIS